MKKTDIFIYLLGTVLALGAFFIMPNNDDFDSLPAPHKLESIGVFLPNGPFWRPFDALWGILMGKCVGVYPYLNHLLVLLLFAFCAYCLVKILNNLQVTGFTKTLSIGIFLLSPALVATTYSIDAINQTLCMAFGIASVLLYPKSKFFAYVMMIMALFSKESGIAWFVATPLLSLLMEEERNGVTRVELKKYKQLLKPYMVSLLLIAVYFTLRILLQQNAIGASGNYAPRLGINSLMGLGLLFGSSLTAIDSIALFLERNGGGIVLSSVISIAFLGMLIKKSFSLSKSNLLRMIECLLVMMMLTAPHLAMGHPGEMHAFSTLWGFALSIGIVFKTANWRKYDKIIVAIFLTCCISVYLHKGYYMYKTGLLAKQRVESAVANTQITPKAVCILDCDPPIREYSVFQASGEASWCKGKATRVYFDFVNPKTIKYHVIQTKDLDKYLSTTKASQKYDAIWVVENNQVSVHTLFKPSN